VRVRGLYTVAGGAWGAVIGAPVAILIAGYTLATAWLFLFGDDPWPAASWLVLLPGPLAGLAIFLTATALGYVYGSRAETSLEREAEKPPDAPTQPAAGGGRREASVRRRAVLLLGLALLAGLFEVAALAAFERGQQRERDAAAALDENFARLVESRHAISSIRAQRASWDGAAAPERTVAIRIEGRRAGGYRLTWELTETLYDTPLLVGEQRLTLLAGDTVVYVPIDIATVRERYRSEVLNGRGGVMVETQWPFRARLRPLLSRSEARELPGRELQNLRLGYSELLSQAEAPVPIAFRID
jgi:hypothetical protein